MPPQGPSGHPPACGSDVVAEADVVKCGKGIGPDADARPRGGVGPAFQDDGMVAPPLQGDCGRQPRDARADDKESMLRHPTNVAPQSR